MKTLPRLAVAFSSVALAGLVFVEMHGPANANAHAASPVAAPIALAAQSSASHAQGAPLVNLPDFSRLVEQAGPAVVNIEAQIGAGEGDAGEEVAGGPPMPGDEQVPEFFRRFFGQ